LLLRRDIGTPVLGLMRARMWRLPVKVKVD
jgi:hypothetical protein